MEHFKGRSIFAFSSKFDSEEKCKKYLAEIKWKDGFNCPKCGNRHAWDGKPFTKVCKNCRYIESATSNTLFHKVKFGLQKAFLILFELASTTKSCSSPVMAAKYEITQKTAWLFMTKARRAMDCMEEDPLSGPNQTIRAIIGSKSESSTGREPAKGKPVVVSIETSGKFGIIKGYSINLSKKDENTPRCELKGTEIHKNVSGTSSLQINRFVKDLKSWLRGIHHQVSSHYLQGYLDEYSFRFNRNRMKENLFHLLIEKMIKGKPAPYQILYNT